MSASTESRLLRSTVAGYASVLARLVVSAGAKMVLARLILPEGHGLYELALRVVTVAAAVRDLGIPFHLMRDARRPYGTALSFSLLSGAVLSIAIILAAPTFAAFDSALPDVLRVFAIWVLLDALTTVPRVYFERELRVGRIAGPEILRGVTMALVAIALAARGWGVWALVIGDLAATALFAGLVLARYRRLAPRGSDWALLPDLVRRSGPLFFIWVASQLVTHVDLFIVAGITGDAAVVGQYRQAYSIPFLVLPIVAPRALLPALVAYADDPLRFAEAFRLGTAFLMAFQVMAAYFLFFNAEVVVSILLGRNWGPAAGLLRILCFVPLVDIFADLGGEVLKVRHEDRRWLAIVTFNLLCLLGFGIVLTWHYGATGMAVANFMLLGNLAMARRIAQIMGSAFGSMMRDLAFIYCLPAPFFCGVALLCAPGSWSRFVGSAAAAVVVALLLARRFHGPMRAFFALPRA